MIEEIFSGLEGLFQEGRVAQRRSYYFSIDDIKKTVTLGPAELSVTDGKAVAEADCVCKTSTEFFLRVWQQGYRPGMGDFLSGAIKSNNPYALQEFLAAFGKG